MSKFISLDVSTNTGFAIFNGPDLLKYGVFKEKVENYLADIKSFRDFPSDYPFNFLDCAKRIADGCLYLIQEEGDIEFVVLEHPEKGKQRLSQRLLEWMHYAIVQRFKTNNIEFKYLLVSDWRSKVKCYLQCWPEYRKWNKEVTSAKKVAIPSKTGRQLAKIGGKVVSKINQKKLSIIIANEYYDLNVKDDNIADAINIGRAAYELDLFKFEGK